MVVDADTYAAVGDIPDTPGVHGIAIGEHVGAAAEVALPGRRPFKAAWSGLVPHRRPYPAR